MVCEVGDGVEGKLLWHGAATTNAFTPFSLFYIPPSSLGSGTVQDQAFCTED